MHSFLDFCVVGFPIANANIRKISLKWEQKNKKRMKFRNKTYFLTVVIALAHVYCSVKIAKTINNGSFTTSTLEYDEIL